MSIWRHLAESYDRNAETLRAKYPLSATSISNNTDGIVVIVINGDGEFREAKEIARVKWDKKAGDYIQPPVFTPFPVTEASASRTSGIEPHPVFDQYEYLMGSGEKFDNYIKQLKGFSESEFATPQVKAIYAYIAKKSVAEDLAGLKPKPKTNIVFEVWLTNHSPSKVWEDTSFFDAWHRYYSNRKKRCAEAAQTTRAALTGKQKLTREEKAQLKECDVCDEALRVDFITGTAQPVSTSHPKKVSSSSANSKLISGNDSTNFTFRGRFEDSTQAATIGYETSQKAHQFLRFLVNDRGITCDTQVILSFAVGSLKNTVPQPLNDTKSIYDFMQGTTVSTETDRQIALRAETGFDYAEALGEALEGYKHSEAMKEHPLTVVLALDAPSDGRMSITFYRELPSGDYLDRIAKWHEGCKWNLQFWSEENEAYVAYIGSPSVDRIIEAVYGRPRGANDESYRKIKKAARERLLRCIFDGAVLPKDYVASTIRRASNPLAVTDKDGRFDRSRFNQLVSTTCALVRKYFHQHEQKENSMSLEKDRRDRDYLYGRLLGAADKLEEYALYKKDNKRLDTAAIRHMQTFAQHPFRAWQTIHGCLTPYLQNVKGSFAFQEIEAIKCLFHPGDFESNASLNGSYLIGYYHERAHIDAFVQEAKNKKPPTLNTETDHE